MSEFGLDSKLIIDETIHGQDIKELKSFLTDKNFPYVPDSQNGSYSNQLSFDLSGIVSTSSELNLANTYLLAPFSINLESSSTWGDTIPPSAVQLKSNFVNLIDSIQLFINNKQMVDQTTMMNLPVSILNKLEMSASDLKMDGRGIGIYPDTYSAVSYSLLGSAKGNGYMNNTLTANGIATSTFDSSASSAKAQNKGALERNSMFVNCSSVVDPSSTLPTIGTTVADRVNYCRAQGLPYFTAGTATGDYNKKRAVWNFIAYIPLIRLHDVFSRMPLLDNAQVRLTLNMNLGSTVIAHSTTTMSLSSTSMTAGNTLPFMFNGATNLTNALTIGSTPDAGSATLTPAGATMPTTGTTTITLAIQSKATHDETTDLYAGYPLLPQTRIYCQTLTLQPSFKEKILANPVKTVRFLEWFQLPINDIKANSNFSQTISTALPNVAVGIIVPFQSDSSTIFTGKTGIAQYKSPFDCAPEQSLPLGMNAFNQLNFSLNGQNVWTNNAQFTYDIFVQEVKSLSLNGGLNKELASGLMDLVDWQFSPVAICDLGDRLDAQSDAYQSIVVSGVNSSAVAVDYKVFIGYWKTYSVNCITGQIEKIF